MNLKKSIFRIKWAAINYLIIEMQEEYQTKQKEPMYWNKQPCHGSI
jgi:hypothetical protein